MVHKSVATGNWVEHVPGRHAKQRSGNIVVKHHTINRLRDNLLWSEDEDTYRRVTDTDDRMLRHTILLGHVKQD